MSRLDFFKSHAQKSWKIYAGILGVFFLFYRLSKPVGDSIAGLLKNHYIAQGGSVSIDNFAQGVLAYSTLLATLLLFVAVTSSVWLYQAKKDAAEAVKTPILKKTFERTTEAADLISKQLFPGVASPVKVVRSCKQVYTVYDNGDCNFNEELTVAAKD